MSDINLSIEKPAIVTVSPSINLNPQVGFESQAEKLLDETKKLVDELGQQVLQANTFLEFPNIGDARFLYVDKEKNKTYRWNSDDLKYYCIGSDYEAIQIVDGGGANNE